MTTILFLEEKYYKSLAGIEGHYITLRFYPTYRLMGLGIGEVRLLDQR